MIRIMEEPLELPSSLEDIKRQILSVRHELERDGKLDKRLRFHFAEAENAIGVILEELKNLLP